MANNVCLVWFVGSSSSFHGIRSPETRHPALVVNSRRGLLGINGTENRVQVRTRRGKLHSVSEPWADTTTPAGMIVTVFAGIAEFERDLIRERTGAGREAAK